MLKFTPSGFSNEDLMINWIEKILLPFKNTREENEVIVFILDAASFHTSKKVESLLKNFGIELIILPGGCTDFLQPLDVCVNKPLKDKVRASYIVWLENVLRKNDFLTKGGYLRAPDMETIIDWILKGMSETDTKMIQDSFTVCGIMWGLHENAHLNQKLQTAFEDLIQKVISEKTTCYLIMER
jgi:hypothetical protein